MPAVEDGQQWAGAQEGRQRDGGRPQYPGPVTGAGGLARQRRGGGEKRADLPSRSLGLRGGGDWEVNVFDLITSDNNRKQNGVTRKHSRKSCAGGVFNRFECSELSLILLY